MAVFALMSLMCGWVLGQFFKVLILVPAGGLSIPLAFAVSVTLGDTFVQTAFKISAALLTLPAGYVLGQTLLHVPRIRSSRKIPEWGIAGLRDLNRQKCGEAPVEKLRDTKC
ncbi:MAG: hypothetical protein L0Y50_11785 [Beijerinckiaceae bacterium]|nr:hypothetical protein [Beijerinckiaceae bacterium]MCI0736929.1 hypothetical protein [Beijerinckiaceae bacterium]